MNSLKGIIEAVNVSGDLSIITVKVAHTNFSAIVIDTPQTDPYLVKGNPIQVIFKETEVIIGVGSVDGISLRNKLFGKVVSIDSDNLLSKLVVDTDVGLITSIITTNSVKRLKIEIGTALTAMIKTNELMLSK
ncbi:MAG: TOBE domain-containing protein [Flavobacteriaceae bacterium]|nr:TOBE domain-containing protein [Flavobacteriaceae bacterium]